MRVSENFTLEQIVVLVSITIVIVAVTLFSLDPLVQLRTARNRQRFSELQTLGGALRSYAIKHEGALPPMIDRVSDVVQLIGDGPGITLEECRRARCRGEKVASFQCWTEGLGEELRPFLVPLPRDPLTGRDEDTRYFVNSDAHGVITVGACDEEAEDLEGSALPPRMQVMW